MSFVMVHGKDLPTSRFSSVSPFAPLVPKVGLLADLIPFREFLDERLLEVRGHTQDRSDAELAATLAEESMLLQILQWFDVGHSTSQVGDGESIDRGSEE